MIILTVFSNFYEYQNVGKNEIRISNATIYRNGFYAVPFLNSPSIVWK